MIFLSTSILNVLLITELFPCIEQVIYTAFRNINCKGECFVGKKKEFKKIQLRRLSEAFYQENNHLHEVMDKNKTTGEFEDKGRGYGVILVPIRGLEFAIPIRSNLPHNFGFVSYREHKPDGSINKSGLDYTKAVVITTKRYVDSRPFKLKTGAEYWNVVYNEEQIILEFEAYVEKYVQAITHNDRHILKEYRWSTLKNYHHELGLKK